MKEYIFIFITFIFDHVLLDFFFWEACWIYFDVRGDTCDMIKKI